MGLMKTRHALVLFALILFSGLKCVGSVEQTDFRATGAITGCVYEMGTPNAIEGAIILIDGNDEPWFEAATAYALQP